MPGRSSCANAKLKLPLSEWFKPYGLAGIGLVNADFEDITINKCATIAGQSGCVSQRVTNANSWFVEFILGAGAMIKLGGPVHLTLEGAWRPSTGYSNDDYDKAFETQKQPKPSRNGYAWSAHAGLALSIGLGALVNAGWLLVGLVRRGIFQPRPGWGMFLLQVVAGTALLAVFLMWAGSEFPWLAWRADAWKRAAAMAGVLAASGAIYFAALWAAGLKLRQFVTR